MNPLIGAIIKWKYLLLLKLWCKAFKGTVMNPLISAIFYFFIALFFVVLRKVTCTLSRLKMNIWIKKFKR